MQPDSFATSGNSPTPKKLGAPKKSHCNRGHDTTSPESRNKKRQCKACLGLANLSSEEIEAKVKKAAEKKALRESPEGKAEWKAKEQSRHATYNNSPKGRNKRRRAQLAKLCWTPELFDQRLLEQGSVCPIGNHPFTANNKPCADHNHANGKPRGVLCRDHNLMLGYAHDNPEELQAAIEYLGKWEEKSPQPFNLAEVEVQHQTV